MVCIFMGAMLSVISEFEYESEGEMVGGESDVFNSRMEDLFYDAEDCKATDPQKALQLFRTVAESSSHWYVPNNDLFILSKEIQGIGSGYHAELSVQPCFNLSK
jgi:hypothetical protein